ncbi:glycosyl transferase [Aeromonas hydrophila]|uniref:glycosyltransferase family 2 protein n=1 Tax=Aeromonas hydrophila TaxID=644 RepID=UPI000E579957|nr:glycosyltransferase family 2 protein [Aeromonas hydrophila]AXV33691.1 glycosyl transferase [Aeromonas hydrophila]NHT33000.1 glycosyltransferase family 2 protein [Aeromonas hydrophila]
MKSPKLGLVTVLYNTPEVLEDFFKSLACQIYNNFILYVIDNSSKPESLRLARELASQYGIETTFIDNEGNNVGVAAGNNQGALAAESDECDYIVFINNDLLFEQSTVFLELVKVAIDDNVKVLSPLILNFPAGNIWYAGGEIDELKAVAPHFMIDEAYKPNTIGRARFTYAPTCFLMIARDIWEQVGLMDERYFAYYDDTDFLYRIVQSGFLVELIPSALIYHKVGSSTGGDISRFGMYHLTRNRIYFIKKNIKGMKKFISLVYTLMTRLFRMLTIKNPELRSAIGKGILDGLKM